MISTVEYSESHCSNGPHDASVPTSPAWGVRLAAMLGAPSACPSGKRGTPWASPSELAARWRRRLGDAGPVRGRCHRPDPLDRNPGAVLGGARGGGSDAVACQGRCRDRSWQAGCLVRSAASSFGISPSASPRATARLTAPSHFGIAGGCPPPACRIPRIVRRAGLPDGQRGFHAFHHRFAVRVFVPVGPGG